MLKEFQSEVRDALLNLSLNFEISKIKEEDKGEMPYTDNLIIEVDGVKVSITIAPTFVCVHNDLLKDFLSKDDVLYLNKKLPRMYELQRERCEYQIAKHEAEIARLKGLIGEQE